MFKLFLYMMKEEWRIHSTMFGNLSFALFPVMIFGIAFMGSFILPLVNSTLPPGDLSLLIHANYLMLGFMTGGFGLLGNEVMNRRFGQASLLSYSARSLPLSDQYIFTNFVLKDTLYYFILWVFPFGAGFLIASPFIGLPVTTPLLLLLTLALSFLSGLSCIFFLTTIYSISKNLLLGILILGIGGLTLITGFFGVNPALLFPPLILFHHFSWTVFIISSLAIIIPFGISLQIFSPDFFSQNTRQYRNMQGALSRRLKAFPNPPLIAKDIIDLYRSGSFIGQTIFSFLIPLVVIWFFISLLGGYIPRGNLLITYAILTGIISSTMYTWLTMFDTYATYACLPVSVRTLIISKISGFMVMQIIPAVYISIICLISGEASLLIPILVLCLSISFYTLGITVFLTGLSPHVLVYDVKNMIRYFALIGVALSIFSTISYANPWYALSSVFLLLPAWLFIKSGCNKWEGNEEKSY